jgi:hypothetical protein
VFAYAGAFVVGLLLGLFGAGIAPVRLVVADVRVPVGLVLVLLALGVVARAAAWALGARTGAALVAAGWALPTAAFVLAGPGGDVLMPDVARTWWYLVGGTVVLALAIVSPLPRGARALAQARRAGRPDPDPAADPAPDPDPSPDPSGSAATGR